MGYSTRFELTVENLATEETIPMTIESVMAEFEKDKLNKSEMLQKLALIRDGMSSQVLDDEIIITRLIEENDEARYCLQKDGSSRSSGRWYEARNDLKKFSQKYPNWLFTLTAEGEQSADIWKSYFLNGKEQYVKARIVLDEFDQNKMV